MKVTPELREELADWLDNYWTTYLRGDIETWATFIRDDYRNIGGTKEEIWNSKQEIINYTNSIMNQMLGTVDIRNRKVDLILYGEYMMVHEFTDLYVKVEGEWIFYGPFRMSSLLEKTNTGWIALHQHGSYPDMKAMEGEAFSIDALKAENAKLQAAVKSRTLELEIETALEKVRAEAMGMNKPDDILAICKIMFTELELLGFSQLRNSLINFWDDERSSLIDYDYSHETGGNKATLSYSSHPVFEQFQKTIKNSKDAFAELIITNEHLESWKQRRRDSGEYEDARLDNISALYYYFYSIEVGAIGISTFSPITEEQLNVLKRFRNVFDFAYRRYADVAQAEAQAREAEIELALERVRARTMAMQRSEELVDVATVLFQQVKGLGVPQWNCGFNIWNIGDKEFTYYPGSPDGIISPSPCKIPLTEHPVFKRFDESRRRGEELLVYEKEGEEQADHYRYMLSLHGVGDLLQSMLDAGFELPRFQIDHLANFAYGNLIFITYEHFPKMLDVFKRFAKVFEQTYTRFLDLQKAEAQAREAEIELGLERVRARAMAMQNSGELSDLVDTLFKELTKLDFGLNWCIINIIDEPSLTNMVWAANPETNKPPESYLMKFEDYPFHHSMLKAYQERKTKHVYVIEGEEKITYDNYLFNETEWRRVPQAAQDASRAMKRYVGTFTFSNFGGLQTVGEEYLSEQNLDILSRFGKVFDLTYTRFNDLLKAEAQAREAQIEIAMERVRSRSMGMQKSEELKEVIKIVYQQLRQLNIRLDHAGFVVDYKPKGDWNFWIADEQDIPSKITHPYFESVWATQFNEAKEKGSDFFTTKLSFEEKNKFYNELLSYVPGLPQASKYFYLNCPGLAASTALLDDVGLYIENFSGTPYTEEENNTLIRFGKVFQQTYTRFLDLQKAEAQAKEAQIEAALERVRSRSMAMHKSDELLEAGEIIFVEMQKLGIESLTAGYVLMDKEEKNGLNYTPHPGTKKIMPVPVIIPHNETIHMQQVVENWKKGNPFFIVETDEEATIKHQTFIAERSTNFPLSAAELIAISPAKLFLHNFYFKDGYILIVGGRKLSVEQIDIMLRFATVFQQTYTRFLDLQKAEAQAREAKIEAALEKVRSRTMAMQNSDELPDAANVLFLEVQKLGIPAWSCGYNVLAKDKRSAICWMSSEGALQEPFTLRLFGEASFDEMEDFLCSEKTMLIQELAGKAIDYHYNYMKSFPDLKATFDHIEANGLSLPTFQVNHLCKYTHGFLLFITYEQVPDAHDIFKRFTKVFEQTYTRFLDLQKAEAQTREAKIEMALEKVRARTMGMQKSGELADVAKVLFTELNSLVHNLWTCGFVLCEKERNEDEWWLSMDDGFTRGFFLPNVDDFAHVTLYEGWLRGETFRAVQLDGSELQAHYDWLMKVPVARAIFEEMDAAGLARPEWQKLHAAYFSKGYLVIITREPSLGEEIFKRFAQVFDLTYTRFLDLQKAEAQAREAIKRASVDRVRAEIASMRTTGDLERIQPLIWNELKILGVPFIRCGVFIMDDGQQEVNTLLSTPDGKAIAAFRQSYNAPGEITAIVESWHKKEIYKQHWDEDQFLSFAKNLVEQGAVTTGEKYLTENRPTDLHLHFLPFLQGMLYVGNTSAFSDDEIQLVQNLADAFSTAYARYEDFNKLEAAKQQVDNTLNELQVTQKQLIQSEKMASLGELTAGIAHEIQNPLNFVNNFSELSNELIDEMMEEVAKGHYEEAKAIAGDVKQNLEKINHHGKRADGIVKGMLQHSRSSSGQKEPTNINVLADEYLRLAYHGLRAKEKSFNATLKTDYDESIGNINIIPQDIGRVILNLISNAFYAVAEKKKNNPQDYEPTVTISTKLLKLPLGGLGVLISVADNGSGIPKKVINKIFQPFFTTKPTGQGTGLGLSLSYDIIKAHGGEFKVETKDGKGSLFIIEIPIA